MGCLRGNGPYGKIPTKKEPIRTPGFTFPYDNSQLDCFGGRKTREERKMCPKIHLFGFPDTLVMKHATTAARNVVSFLTLIARSNWEGSVAEWLERRI